jgi:hypothetical protein
VQEEQERGVARRGMRMAVPLLWATKRSTTTSLVARAGHYSAVCRLALASVHAGNGVGPGKALQYGGATRGAAIEESWGAGGLGNTRPRATRGGGSDGKAGGRPV